MACQCHDSWPSYFLSRSRSRCSSHRQSGHLVPGFESWPAAGRNLHPVSEQSSEQFFFLGNSEPRCQMTKRNKTVAAVSIGRLTAFYVFFSTGVYSAKTSPFDLHHSFVFVLDDRLRAVTKC